MEENVSKEMKTKKNRGKRRNEKENGGKKQKGIKMWKEREVLKCGRGKRDKTKE